MSTVLRKMCNIDVEDPNDIVVSGISGRFPNSENITEFEYNLYNKIDMIDDVESRWRHANPEIPRRLGKVKNLHKFDASFFGVNLKQAQCMDPQGRMLLEHSYEAILDSGTCPKNLRGSNTAVLIGVSFNESEKIWIYEKVSKDGFGLTGSARTMLANRISFALALNGPSLAMDTACSSSMYAIDYAYKLMASGEVDSAIVGGANLLLQPYVTLQFARLGVLSKNESIRPFDKDSSGYIRSEANCVFFLQRRKNAKRVYATLVHSKTNCDGYKEEGINFPSHKIQTKLLTEFYEEIGVSPNTPKLAYVEAHCTATKVGDPEECKTLDEVFCTGRDKQLLVGSVKSNMGHAEPASGICSVTKVLLTFENQKIPPNINFSETRPEIKGLIEGRMKVVVDTTDLEGPLICVNSFGFGGANAHALYASNPKAKINRGMPEDSMPRLVVWSGRSEEAIGAIMDSVTKNPLDAEYIALLQSSQVESASANIYRGYGVFVQNQESENAICVSQDALHFSGIKRPIVWVYSGMGSQWVGMGRDLMKIPIFADSIEKSHKILLRKKLDLKKIITSEDATTFDNILHSFVGIAAIQIGLTDILKSLGLEPDHIIGHSVGELGCAYADGCFTAEEMILSAYSRGMASLETKVVRGSMAAVGVGYQELKEMLPKGVEIACHNSNQSSTISGPSDNISKFVKELTEKGIFAKEVPCSNIPYHSSFIAEMGPKLLAKISEVVKIPKKRSLKWISSSYPQSRWEEPESQLSSPHYHTNNLLSPVLFEEASALLPEDSLMIEIAPHGLLQAILKKSFPEAVHIPLTQRNHKNNEQYFVGALGKIYSHGYDLNLPLIYPEVDFPVSRGTQMISPLIKWDHSHDHFVMLFENHSGEKSCERKVSVALNDSEFEFISGHRIDGRCLFPATGYIFLVWETLAIIKGFFFFDIGVEFEDIKFVRATSMSSDLGIDFTIVIHPGTGKFEISEKGTTLVTGIVRHVEKPTLRNISTEIIDNQCVLPNRDFYKELRLRGYHYSGLFRSVVEGSSDGLNGKVKWDANWVAFLDCLLQVQIIGYDSRSLMLPTSIQKMIIDPHEQVKLVKAFGEDEALFDVQYSPKLKNIRSGGIEIINLQASTVGRRKPLGDAVLESYKFVPFVNKTSMKTTEAVRVLTQLALESAPTFKVKAVEVDSLSTEQTILPEVRESLRDMPLVVSELIFLSSKTLDDDDIHTENLKLSTQSDCYLVIASDCLTNFNFLEKSSSSFRDHGFLICRESPKLNPNEVALPEVYQIVSTIETDKELLCMLQLNKKPMNYKVAIKISEEGYEWIDRVKTAIKAGPTVLVAENETSSGLIGLVNCLRKEPDGSQVISLFIDDLKAPTFSLDNPFYQNQLNLGLPINVLRNGKWGSYRHLQIQSKAEQRLAYDHCYVNTLVKSDLTSLKWIKGPFNFMKTQKPLVRVQYAALNFKDVMLATGKISAEVSSDNRISNDCVLGFEYSGVTSSGRRVMGMVKAAAMSTHVEPDEGLTYNCPDDWTLAEAATVPCVYVTVYTAFFLTAKIERGQSVLIHAGCGGVGLAAIRVAFAYGLEVFTTVSTDEKRKYLLSEFPQLKQQNIGNSRDVSFEDMIMTRTNGKGVDYVLNSLAGEKLQASIRCLGKGGKFLEIGKFDLESDTKIGLRNFLNELSFHAIMVDKLITGSLKTKLKMKSLIENDIGAGIIKPLKVNIFEASQVEQAFRLLASGKHIGKVLLKIRIKENDPSTLPISVISKVYCNPELSYIIPGGLGGFGLELADWLVLRGCKNLVLSSSRGITKQYQAYRIKIWESYGVKVNVNTSDISTKSGCEKLIRDSMKLGPVGGIFNLAVVLKDSIFDNQDSEKFVDCMAPKAVATKHLDELSRVLCPDLQYFVVFSSVSCGRGNAGQSNYGMANSVMERIMEQRHNLGLPAKAIQWGAVGEVGLVADMQEDNLEMEIGGTLQQRISSCLEELDPLMTIAEPIVSSMVVAEKRFSAANTGNVLESIMNIMGIRDMKSFSMETTLSELGMDSLMTVEIQQTLEREFDIIIAAQELRSITVKNLVEMANNKKLQKEDSSSSPVGIGLMLRNVGDEKQSGKLILQITDQLKGNKTLKNFIFPGIEGVAGEIWSNLAVNLQGSSFVIQHKNAIQSNLSDLSNQMVNELLKLHEENEVFNIIGYSFGSLIALRMANILESKGRKVKLLLIDGSPYFLKELTKLQVGDRNVDEVVEILVLNGVTDLVIPNKSQEVIECIQSSLSLNDKITKLSKISENFRFYSESHVKSLINTIINNVKLLVNLDLTEFSILSSTKIHLVRPQDSVLTNVERDYGLSNLSKNPIDVTFVEGNHMTMLDSMELKKILIDSAK